MENPFPKKIRDKDTMQKYLDTDEKVSEVSLKVEYYVVMLNYIESILKQLDLTELTRLRMRLSGIVSKRDLDNGRIFFRGK